LQPRYTQVLARDAADTSKTLVNSRSNEIVNIRSTKLVKEFFTPRARPYQYGTADRDDRVEILGSMLRIAPE
jgi:hypothetical protein